MKESVYDGELSPNGHNCITAPAPVVEGILKQKRRRSQNTYVVTQVSPKNDCRKQAQINGSINGHINKDRQKLQAAKDCSVEKF